MEPLLTSHVNAARVQLLVRRQTPPSPSSSIAGHGEEDGPRYTVELRIVATVRRCLRSRTQCCKEFKLLQRYDSIWVCMTAYIVLRVVVWCFLTLASDSRSPQPRRRHDQHPSVASLLELRKLGPARHVRLSLAKTASGAGSSSGWRPRLCASSSQRARAVGVAATNSPSHARQTSVCGTRAIPYNVMDMQPRHPSVPPIVFMSTLRTKLARTLGASGGLTSATAPGSGTRCLPGAARGRTSMKVPHGATRAETM